jgi:hypothetical protein
MAQQKDKPIMDFRAGGIQAGVWCHEAQKDGRRSTRYSVKIQKQFLKDGGGYETTDCFFPEELPRLQLLAQKAYEYIVLAKSKDPEKAVPV